MRVPIIALSILVGLSSCDRAVDAEQATVATIASAVTFDGADAKDEASVRAHGERLSWVLGCHGCHGKSLEGQRFYESYASNLTRDLRHYSDADIVRALKKGERPNRKPMWGMPSELFHHLSEADMAALIAELRSLKRAGEPTQPMLPFEAETKELIAKGEFKPAADFVQELKDVKPVDLGPKHALGRYITMVACAECHGPELKGRPNDTPDLIVVGGYSREEFDKLITTGVPPRNRKLKELMQDVARNRYSRLTPHERDALYAYLKARAELPQ